MLDYLVVLLLKDVGGGGEAKKSSPGVRSSDWPKRLLLKEKKKADFN